MNSPAIDQPLPAPDLAYIHRRRPLLNFLAHRYWRIETHGLEHLPAQGRAILVGNHRGFQPWDAVMVLHVIHGHTGRIPRFLVHPGLLKFRPIARSIARLGGVLACRENAARLLEAGELLGILPEGVEGAFSLYRDAYQLRSFGRNDFVKFALRHRAPIVPFVIVGSADALPMFARIKSRWWTRHMQWPYIPIALPAPLPSKWHLQFLPPLRVEQSHPAEAGSDRSVVTAISLEVRSRMQQAIDEILARRKSIFRGSVF